MEDDPHGTVEEGLGWPCQTRAPSVALRSHHMTGETKVLLALCKCAVHIQRFGKEPCLMHACVVIRQNLTKLVMQVRRCLDGAFRARSTPHTSPLAPYLPINSMHLR